MMFLYHIPVRYTRPCHETTLLLLPCSTGQCMRFASFSLDENMSWYRPGLELYLVLVSLFNSEDVCRSGVSLFSSASESSGSVLVSPGDLVLFWSV